MPDAPSRMPRAHGRRAVLGALGLAAASLPLAACGIRLEDDAPRLPLIPTREPIPGESFLLDLWLGSGELAELATALGGGEKSLPARLAPLHAEQERVVRDLLVSLSVPEKVLADATAQRAEQSTGTATATDTPDGTPAGTPTGVPTGAPTTAAPAPSSPTPEALAQREAGALASESFTSLARLGEDAVVTAGAMLSQRAAGATLLGRPITWPETEWSSPALAAGLLETTRAALYGLEVAAAQSNGAQRTLATTTLAALRARAAEQGDLAGASAPAPALGYPLPFAVTSPASARKLGVHVLSGLRQAVAAQLASAVGQEPQLTSLVRWLADTEVLASRWGTALEPFPGLE